MELELASPPSSQAIEPCGVDPPPGVWLGSDSVNLRPWIKLKHYTRQSRVSTLNLTSPRLAYITLCRPAVRMLRMKNIL